MRAVLIYGLAALLLVGLVGCTIKVYLDPIDMTGNAALPFTGGMEVIELDLSDNSEFMRYQNRFRGFDSVAFSLQALNLSGSDQQLRAYASQDGSLTRNQVPTQATWLANVDIPMANVVQTVRTTLADSGRRALEDLLSMTPPRFFVYVLSEADSTLGLAVSNITFEPGAARFSIFRITSDGTTTEVEIRLADE